MQLDFSQFHPLDHFPGSWYCRSLPGGTRNHLVMDWQYRRKNQLRAHTLCKFGWHTWQEVWARRDDDAEQVAEDRMWRPWKHRAPDFEACGACGKDRE